jgi:serine protease Do
MKLLWAGAWKVGTTGTLMVLLVSMSLAAAPPVEKETPLPEAFLKKAPEGVADLRAIQERVKAVLKKAIPAVVAIIIRDPFERGTAAGSGVIITEDGFVLTAGHISQTPNQECVLILGDGKRVKGKTLGWHKSADAGLIKIVTKGKYPHLEMGDSRKLNPGNWCLTVGHPGGYKPGRPPVVRLGRVLFANRALIQTDTPLVGGDSGGPLFDMHGKVIGIHSWITDQISGNMHVPVNIYRDEWDRLAKGESWGTPLGEGQRRTRSQAYLGVTFDPESDDLKIVEVYKGKAAEKAGLKAGDVLVRIDDHKLSQRDDLTRYLRSKKPGEEITVEARRDGKPVKFRVTLTRRSEE